jgi:dephospho-CoA kinase
MKIYLIEGVSGTGKTTVCEELKRRGFKAVEADEELAHFADPKTGLPTDEKIPDNWLWNEAKFNEAIQQEGDKPVFICGGAMNQEDFKHHFEKVFTLHIDDETLKQRLATRTNNDFGKKPDELALQLEWNKGVVSYSQQRGTSLIDATKPISEVVDEILNYVS